MTTRTTAPTGAPCWADLWTSDVEGSRRFYGELLGWESEAPNPDFGGYFMFTRDGVPVAGAMGDTPDNPAQDLWKVYLATDDIAATVEAAGRAGAEVVVPVAPVGDLGFQAVVTDPAGAGVGVWQPVGFAGFSTLDEPGTPSWFELFTADYPPGRRLLPLGVPVGHRGRGGQRRVPLHGAAAGRVRPPGRDHGRVGLRPGRRLRLVRVLGDGGRGRGGGYRALARRRRHGRTRRLPLRPHGHGDRPGRGRLPAAAGTARLTARPAPTGPLTSWPTPTGRLTSHP